jgi:hypothetical protein
MENIITSIYTTIIELSDLDLQRKLWLNQENNTGLISSYSELMCSLFDDLYFDYFVENEVSKIDLPNSAIVELRKLRELLNGYDEKSSDVEIINDPEWKKVVEQAKIVIKEWGKK